MINTDFIKSVKELIGKTYAECDCAAVIRKSLNIAFSGTNWLFRSINNSSKYRYLKERHACGDGYTPPPGAVVFKTERNCNYCYDNTGKNTWTSTDKDSWQQVTMSLVNDQPHNNMPP